VLVRVPLKFLFQHFKSADNIVMTDNLSVQEAISLYIENCFSDIIILIGIASQNAPRSRTLSGKDFKTGNVAREGKEGGLGEMVF
jgi:hypothetical protein